MDTPLCRFGGHAPAVVRVAMDQGCVCYPEDRKQDLCAQHDYKSEPLGSYEVIKTYREEPTMTDVPGKDELERLAGLFREGKLTCEEAGKLCKGGCTVNMIDGRIMDPDCFR